MGTDPITYGGGMVEKDEIKRIVEKIVENVEPRKVVLFGSHASGNPAKHSDLDLLVVMDSNVPNIQLGREIRKLFYGYSIPMDIIVYSQKEIDEWKNVKMAFPTTIARTGKVLYEKQS